METMRQRAECPGWPAPHVPPLVLRDGDGPTSHGICGPCAAIVAITQAPASSPRLARFLTRLKRDIDTRYVTGSQWSERDRQLHMERLR